MPPTRTFSEELELDVGGRAVHLIELGLAHLLFVGVTPIMWAGPTRARRERHFAEETRGSSYRIVVEIQPRADD